MVDIEALLRRAEAGDPQAQLQAGVAYMTGQGVPAQNPQRGREWLERSAAAGHPEALRFLGVIFLRGMDVQPDFARGVRCLESALETGDPEAAWFLAGFRGGSRDEWYDPVAARELLHAAADSGHARARAHLAYCCLTGFGGERDPCTAVRWFAEAAGQGDGGAMLALAEFSLAGLCLPRDRARAYWLARDAAGQGWEVAGEVAEELAGAGEPVRPARVVPDPGEISERHVGALPAPQPGMLSWAPRVAAIRSFLSAYECAEIVRAASEHLLPSFIVSKDGSMGHHRIRTSQEVRLRPGLRNVVINAVERKMAEWSHFPLENGEIPLVLRYEKSQSFEQHYDYFIPEDFAMGEGPLEYGGQRIATQLIYLNERYTGGETRFDRAGVEVRPRRGLCIIFHNVLPNHNVDPLTRHTGVAVEAGVKWVLSRWIREIPVTECARGLHRDQYRSKS